MIASIATAVLPVCRSPMINFAGRGRRESGPVDRLESSLQRLADRPPVDDAGRDALDAAGNLRRGPIGPLPSRAGRAS